MTFLQMQIEMIEWQAPRVRLQFLDLNRYQALLLITPTVAGSD